MTNEYDFDAVPSKIYADSVSIRIINGLQHIAFQSGKETHCFLVPLPTAKFLGKALMRQVEEVEQKNGITIDAPLPGEPLLSPWTSRNPGDDRPDKQ